MKKVIVCLLLSAVIGSLLGVYSFKMFNKEEKVSSNYKDVYAIQVGVFEDINNANEVAKKYGALVVKDNNKYRVFIAIVKDSLDVVKKYFDDKKIAYYVRSINVSDSFYNYLITEEIKLLNSDLSKYDEIINNILRKFEEEI